MVYVIDIGFIYRFKNNLRISFIRSSAIYFVGLFALQSPLADTKPTEPKIK